MAARRRRRPSPRPRSPSARSESDQFVEDLVQRGEAVPAEPGGALPPGATHEVVPPEVSGQTPKVRRRRFSISG